jgi:hypothetical protein
LLQTDNPDVIDPGAEHRAGRSCALQRRDWRLRAAPVPRS